MAAEAPFVIYLIYLLFVIYGDATCCLVPVTVHTMVRRNCVPRQLVADLGWAWVVWRGLWARLKWLL
jgi:hypothetical protein